MIADDWTTIARYYLWLRWLAMGLAHSTERAQPGKPKALKQIGAWAGPTTYWEICEYSRKNIYSFDNTIGVVSGKGGQYGRP